LFYLICTDDTFALVKTFHHVLAKIDQRRLLIVGMFILNLLLENSLPRTQITPNLWKCSEWFDSGNSKNWAISMNRLDGMVHQYGRFPDVKKWMNEIGVDLERKYVE
jgi:hypothetical protein